MIASESVALQALGFEMVGYLQAGEEIFVSSDGKVSLRQCEANPIHSP